MFLNIRIALYILISIPSILPAQGLLPATTTALQDSLLQIGIKLYDEGNYDQAIKVYSSLLRDNVSHVAALAELSLTYFAIHDYDNTIQTALEGLKYDSKYRPSLYLYLGNAYDLQGKKDESISSYRNGLTINPADYMLHFNLGLAYHNSSELDSARLHYQSALRAKPSHATSNLAIGELYQAMNKRIPAIFAYSRFLILEPSSNRSVSVATKLLYLLSDSLSITQNRQGKFTINVTPDSDAVDGDLSTLALSLAMVKAASIAGDSVYSSPLSKIASELSSLFQITSELITNNHFEGFCWTYYASYFAALHTSGYVPVMVRYIFQSTQKHDVLEYVQSHVENIQEFKEWDANYQW